MGKWSLTEKSNPRHRFKSRLIRSPLISKIALLRLENLIYLDNCQPSQPYTSIMYITSLFLNFGLKIIFGCLEFIWEMKIPSKTSLCKKKSAQISFGHVTIFCYLKHIPGSLSQIFWEPAECFTVGGVVSPWCPASLSLAQELGHCPCISELSKTVAV